MRSLLNDLRQLLYPTEFRIAAPVWPDGWQEMLQKLIALPVPPTDPGDNNDKDEKERARFLADVATGVWRLGQKMVIPGTDRPKEEFRREYRHLQSILDVLSQHGLEIQTHTGQPFDSGQAIKVLTYQPTPGVRRERVSETIKPTIYYRKHHIQMGEVIVETPERISGADSTPPATPTN